eukprot:6183148-Pleurochrysis_carterae.AAC.2
MLDSLDTTARSAAEAASAAQASTLPLDTLSGACARSVSSSGDESAAAAEPVSALEAFGAQAVLAVVEPMLEHCTQALASRVRFACLRRVCSLYSFIETTPFVDVRVSPHAHWFRTLIFYLNCSQLVFAVPSRALHPSPI